MELVIIQCREQTGAKVSALREGVFHEGTMPC